MSAPPETAGFPRELESIALRLGASAARVIPAADVVARETLASMCAEPRCENYGTSALCPPNVAGPAGFREAASAHEHALVLKLDVPTDSLLSEQRGDIFRLLHELVAGVERAALMEGFSRAMGFAGGCCKQLYCANLPNCSVLDGGGPCSHHDSARPSMSGFGVDVAALMRSADLSFHKVSSATSSTDLPLSEVVGLVLFD